MMMTSHSTRCKSINIIKAEISTTNELLLVVPFELRRMILADVPDITPQRRRGLLLG